MLGPIPIVGMAGLLGYAQVSAEAAMEERRASILELLEDRFGKHEVEPFVSTLARIESLDFLRSLNRTASRCASLDEFQAALAST